MKRLLLIVLILVLTFLYSTALAGDSFTWSRYMSLPSRYEQQSFRSYDVAPYIVCWFEQTPGEKYIEYAVDFRAEHLPNGTYLAVANWTMNSDQLSRQYRSFEGDYGDTVGGYCGFQVLEDGTRGAILTIWDIFCTDAYGNTTVIRAEQVYPENQKGAERDEKGLEGSFLHTFVPYEWEEDHNYRALLQITDNWNTGNAHLKFWVFDLSTGVWTLLAEFALGYGEAYMTDFAAFLENYLPQFAGEVRSMLLSNCRVHPIGGDWKAVRSAYILQNFDHPGSYNYGSEGGQFFAITCGLPGRCPNPQPGNYSVGFALGTSPY